MTPHRPRMRRIGIAITLAVGASLVVATQASADPSPTPTPSGTASPSATASPAATDTPAPAASASPTSSATPTPSASSDAQRAAAPTGDPWAAKPYLGWSSYSMQVYSGDGAWITADQIIAQSDAMHAKLQKFGYDHINIDAGWNGGFDEYGRPTPNEKLYPQGFQKVINHIHRNGQKVGVYLIPGIGADLYTAAKPILGAPGCTTHDIVAQPLQQANYWNIGYKIDFTNPCSQEWVDSVADLLGTWGIDFVKFDSVTPGSGIEDGSVDSRADVAAWSSALKRNRIWFELSWALDIDQADYWRSKADGWRVEWDVECYCAHEALTQWENIARLFPRAADWWRHAGNGGWNDFDSLDVGNGSMDGLTRDERQTATTLWAMSAAPMYTGNDLTNLDAYGTALLTNPEVIGVNQAGTPARPVSTATGQQVWYALQADGSYTVALFNLGRTEKDVTATWSDLGLTGKATVRDLWTHKDLGTFGKSYTASGMPIHGSRLLKVTPAGGNTVSVNDDALRLDYSGNWTRNDNREVAATSQPLTVNVTSTGTPTPPTGGGASRTLTLDDTDAAIAYGGSWSTSTNRGLGDYGDGVHYTEKNGDSATYSFQGTGVAYLTETDTSQGDVDVYLDGSLVKTVSTVSSPRASQQKVFEAQGLTDGAHTLRLVKASGQFMLVDRIDVTQTNLLTPTEVGFDTKAPADASVTLLRDPGELASVANAGTALKRGTDYAVSGSKLVLKKAYLATLPSGATRLDVAFRGDYLDDVHATTVDGDAVSYRFTGTGVEWVAPSAPDQGKVAVYLDGRKVTTVDTASATRRTGQKAFGIDGLTPGAHTIKLVKAGGDVMRTDVIRYSIR